ncbi:MAG: phosphonate C-P lyase system protein PhnH [Oscillospiraceae bacterium]|jgi:alpha-D-ribose 1-methylphosphonate 5-triphosphate synthase subunit PhnH|nr:phosphonate C-P lyase system protein PhnH [Oscillospiraceae bacterium]
MNYNNALLAQQAFKAVMNAFARPFRVYRLPEGLSELGESPALKLLAFTLTDNTVTLYVHDGAAEAELRELTSAGRAELELADFVILRGSDGYGLLSRVRRGDLIDPQKGATVIIYLPRLEGAVSIRAAGPGIDGEMIFAASECVSSYLRESSELDIEYPAGFEMLFVTPRGELLAAPRRVRREVL